MSMACRRFNPAGSLFSRAYVSFVKAEDLAKFSQVYDGHVFRDKQGQWDDLECRGSS